MLLVISVRLGPSATVLTRTPAGPYSAAQERVSAVVDSVGEEQFVASLRALRDLTEAEMRQRISEIEDEIGAHRTLSSWVTVIAPTMSSARSTTGAPSRTRWAVSADRLRA